MTAPSGSHRPAGGTGHGKRVPVPELASFEMPHPIVARLALEVLYQALAQDNASLGPEEEAVEQALDAMHAKLWNQEMQAVAATSLTAHYLIIRPVNPLHLPGPEATTQISDAIATLIRHGLIARAWSDQ